MKREEQRIQASVTYNEQHGKLRVVGGSAILSDEEYITFNKNPDFIAGATWADEHPKEGLVDINKVTEWISDNLWDYIDTEWRGHSIELKKIHFDEMYDDLRKAMEE